MARIIILFIMGAHGVIHLMGFVKSAGLGDINDLKLDISRIMGLIWLSAFLLFTAAFILLLLRIQTGWLFTFPGIILSQALILRYWQDAKFGTIANIILLVAFIIGFGDLQFNRKINAEIHQLLDSIEPSRGKMITGEMLSELPGPVKKWLVRAGMKGREMIRVVRLRQNASIKMKPGQKNWTHAMAEQYFNADVPAFIWRVRMKMAPIGFISGRDRFVNGRGEMLIKLFSVFPVINVSGGEKMNQGTLQRYLSEIIWFPSTALNPHITWEEIDGQSAKAVMDYSGISVQGIFHFNDNGDFEKFVTERYMGGDDEAELKRWTVIVKDWKSFNGVRVPSKCEVTWELDTGPWTWLKMEIANIDYNISEKY